MRLRGIHVLCLAAAATLPAQESPPVPGQHPGLVLESSTGEPPPPPVVEPSPDMPAAGSGEAGPADAGLVEAPAAAGLPSPDGIDGFQPPQAPDPARYQMLADPSPFTTRASVDPGDAAAGFPDLSLVGIVPVNGKMTIWVQPKDSDQPVQLVEGGEAKDGMRLLKILSPENMYAAEAEIEAGGQRGKLRFTADATAVAPGAGAPKAGAASGNAQAVRPGRQQGAGGQPQQPQPIAVPGQPGPQQPPVMPRRRIVLPR